MPHKPNGPGRIRILLVVAAAVAMVGCGVSTEAVQDALPPQPTVSVPPTEAPTTTTVPSTTPPTSRTPTTEAPTTSGAPDVTGGTGGTLPGEVKDAFMRECTQGAGAPTCECIWGELEGDLSVTDLLEAGTQGSLPPDLQKKIVAATTRCLVGGGN